MRIVVPAVLGLMASTPAFAGGVGLALTGGAHTEQVYLYSDHTENGDVEFEDINDYEQFQMSQTLPHYGGGLEFILGDRDDKIVGVTRLYYLRDAPQLDPAQVTEQVNPDFVVANVRDEARHIGYGMVGLSWGIIGDPSGFMFNAVGHVGSAFLTVDHTEHLALDIGPGVTYKVARQVVLFGDVAYQARFRKEWSHSANVFVGARYMFD
jgi:hypothetical protein